MKEVKLNAPINAFGVDFKNIYEVIAYAIDGKPKDGVYVGEGEAFAADGDAHPTLSVAYYPSIDTWNGRDKLQINIQSYF